MRRACLAVLLALTGCASPTGATRNGCNADWLEVPAVAAQASGAEEEILPVECIDEIANRRLRIGFSLPAGPTCHVLGRVELLESADTISITLIGAVNDDPNAGACPEEAQMVVTEVDLAAPADDRRLLDGSAAEEAADIRPRRETVQSCTPAARCHADPLMGPLS